MATNDLGFLSKNDSAILKGLLILVIVFHNFLHLVDPVKHANEFQFNIDNFIEFKESVLSSECLNSIFSFMGFIAIYVFFFISGYGLTKSYAKKKTGATSFTLRGLKKLYALLLIGCLSVVIVKVNDIPWRDILHKLTLTDNLSKSTVSKVSGPWWFMICLFQLYLLFVPLYLVISKKFVGYFVLLLASLLGAYYLIFCSSIDPVLTRIYYYNFPGHIPEFALGIFVACYEKQLSFLNKKTYQCLILGGAATIYGISQINPYIWLFQGLSSAIMILAFYKIFAPILNLRSIAFVGMISSYIYILHGHLFRKTFVAWANDFPNDAIIKLSIALLWAIFVIAVSTGTFYLVKYCKSAKNKYTAS